MSALAIPGYSVKELAETHNVSRTSIYNLQRVAQNIKEMRYPIQNNNFIELAVKDSLSSTLENASLTFKDFSFTIEGKVTSSGLIAIIKVLEEQSC